MNPNVPLKIRPLFDPVNLVILHIVKFVGILPAGHNKDVLTSPIMYGIDAVAPNPLPDVRLTEPIAMVASLPLPVASGSVFVELFHNAASYIPHGVLFFIIPIKPSYGDDIL